MNFEIKFYELLGIRLFQKMVFLLERIIHFQDGKKNINYHFKQLNYEEAEGFAKFLFYNGSIHFKNLITILVYLIVKIILGKWHFIDYVVILFGIKDLYCVMLQRYNYLRIKIFISRINDRNRNIINKKVKKIIQQNANQYNKDVLEEDLKFINELRNKLQNNKCVVIENGDIEKIKRLNEIIKVANG